MASTINASNASSGGIITTADASGVLQLQTANTTAMTIDASQNVGIGTSSPSTGTLNRQLTVNSGASNLAGIVLQNNNTGTAYNDGTYLTTLNTSDFTIVNQEAGYVSLGTNNTERMRIDSGGNVGIGITSFGTIAPLTVATASVNPNYGQITAYSITSGDVARAGMSVVKYDNNTTTSQILFKFLINQGANGSGQINSNGANACAFGTYSDARLKENITPLESELDKIVALKPCEFDFIKSEGGGHQIGFIAQEMQNIYPDAVGERDDGMLTISGWDKTTARLVKAIQELKAIIDAQAERIAALEAK